MFQSFFAFPFWFCFQCLHFYAYVQDFFATIHPLRTCMRAIFLRCSVLFGAFFLFTFWSYVGDNITNTMHLCARACVCFFSFSVCFHLCCENKILLVFASYLIRLNEWETISSPYTNWMAWESPIYTKHIQMYTLCAFYFNLRSSNALSVHDSGQMMQILYTIVLYY